MLARIQRERKSRVHHYVRKFAFYTNMISETTFRDSILHTSFNSIIYLFIFWLSHETV